MELSDWFKGFEKGIAKLTAEQREQFDVFFSEANELPGVRCETIEKGSVYNLYFLECTCGLHKQGYVSTPLLCECSRQSILYVLHSLWNDRTFRVTICESILRGSQHCKMRIEAKFAKYVGNLEV